MDRSLIIFEYSPWFILLCLLCGALFSYLLYNQNDPWSNQIKYMLAGLRFILVSLLAFLLIGPIIRQIQNNREQPIVVFAIDNSASIREINDSSVVDDLTENLVNLKNNLESRDFQVFYKTFSQEKPVASLPEIRFDHPSTDINRMLQDIQSEFEGRNLASVVLLSDGIYNLGTSPNFSTFNFDIHTIGIGDTIPRKDISLKTLYYNKISYQGNKFPIIAEIINQGFTNQAISVSVKKSNKVMETQTVPLNEMNRLTQVEFLLEATDPGMQRYEIEVAPVSGEFTLKNNSKQAYIDVVKGKEKVLIVAASPHPDIKALTTSIETNRNYELTLFIPGLNDQWKPDDLDREKYDLVIFHQAPDLRGKLASLFRRVHEQGFSTLTIVGPQTNLQQFNLANQVVTVGANRYQSDQVLPVFNTAFSYFELSEDLRDLFLDFPPVSVPFANLAVKNDAEALLYQKVGSIETFNPLLLVQDINGTKSAVMLGIGSWRWRLHEFYRENNHKSFNELFTKLIQFLSSKEDKRKFKVYPTSTEITSGDGVEFVTELYNDLFERVYNNQVELKVTDEAGNQTQYAYVPSEANSKYRIDGLQEGIYRYTATTDYNGLEQRAEGEFLIRNIQLESINLTADFNLLRKLSQNGNGKFFLTNETDQLQEELQKLSYPAIIHSNEFFLPVINLELLFFLLLTLVSIEWFTRKYRGTY